MIFSIIACGAIPFCWCCLAPIIFAVGVAHAAACYAAFDQRCRTG